MSTLRERLKSIEWFGRIGQPVSAALVKAVSSWDEAFVATANEVTKWCGLEAGLSLYNRLAGVNYERFRRWNDIAKSNLPIVDEAVHIAITAIGSVPFPKAAITHLQSILTGSLMEEAYDDVLSVTLCRKQFDWLVAGQFPCGWECDSADSFPDRAVLLVF